MATRQTPRTSTTRKTSTSPSRFSRPGTAAGRSSAPKSSASRFNRPSTPQRPAAKGKKKQQSGVGGLVTSALSAVGGKQAAKSKGKNLLRSKPSPSSGGGKAKPAIALLGLAGAALGRKQMQKRKQSDATEFDVTVAPASTTPPVTPAA